MQVLVFFKGEEDNLRCKYFFFYQCLYICEKNLYMYDFLYIDLWFLFMFSYFFLILEMGDLVI